VLLFVLVYRGLLYLDFVSLYVLGLDWVCGLDGVLGLILGSGVCVYVCLCGLLGVLNDILGYLGGLFWI